jgi:hypothetical protein
VHRSVPVAESRYEFHTNRQTREFWKQHCSW